MNSQKTTPTVEDRLAKLKQLQKRKAQSSKTNRRELFHEQKKNNLNKLPPLDQIQHETDDKNKEKLQRLKNLDYTLEESEEWEQKQQQKRENQSNSGFQDYSQLAEQAYRKEVSHLSKSTIMKQDSGQPLSKPKTKQLNQNTQLTNYNSISTDEEDDETVEDFTNKPSKQAIDNLASSLKTARDRKYKSRLHQRAKNEAQGETVIGGSTKERDFNLKLERYFESNKKS